ncbi:MAG TPA: hypothetical protein VE994_08950 [Terriglobales bacterium]|nr:hypothetical protein [Terriglobales bacterium]
MADTGQRRHAEELLLHDIATTQPREFLMEKRVLSISYDVVLLNTRSMILRQEGYAVQSAQTLQDAVELSQRTRFDAAIIGHSIPEEDQRRMAEEVRTNCDGVWVIALTRREGEQLPFADRAIDAQKPEELVAELRRMLKEKVANQDGGSSV